MGAERLGSSLLGTASGPGAGISCGATVPGDPQSSPLTPCRTSSTVPSLPCRPGVETAPPTAPLHFSHLLRCILPKEPLLARVLFRPPRVSCSTWMTEPGIKPRKGEHRSPSLVTENYPAPPSEEPSVRHLTLALTQCWRPDHKVGPCPPLMPLLSYCDPCTGLSAGWPWSAEEGGVQSVWGGIWPRSSREPGLLGLLLGSIAHLLVPEDKGGSGMAAGPTTWGFQQGREPGVGQWPTGAGTPAGTHCQARAACASCAGMWPRPPK